MAEADRGREWRGLGARDSMNPTNKKGLDELPANSPCRNCIHFAGLKWVNGDISMRVMCESAWELGSTLIVFNTEKTGGGGVGDGECFNTTDGYADAGVRFGGRS